MVVLPIIKKNLWNLGYAWWQKNNKMNEQTRLNDKLHNDKTPSTQNIYQNISGLHPRLELINIENVTFKRTTRKTMSFEYDYGFLNVTNQPFCRLHRQDNANLSQLQN